MHTPLVRILAFFVALMFVLLTPWWISIPLTIGLAVYFPTYLEILVFGFLFDSLYSAQYAMPYTGLLSAFVVLVVIIFIRDRIRT